MNRSTLVTVILAILLIAVSAFAYKMYNDAVFWESAATEKDKVNRELSKNYNKAAVEYVKAIKNIKPADPKTVVKERRVKEVIYVDVPVYSSGGGTITAASGTTDVFEYKDFRLSATVYTSKRTLRYSLLQHFRTNIYRQVGDDYRVEILEVDPDGNIVGTYEVSDFTVIKEVGGDKWNFGFNMMLGAGYTYGTGGHDWDVSALFNFISHGETHLDSTIRVLSIGAGKMGFILAPVSYRISNHIPFFSDLHVYPYVGKVWKGRGLFAGIGLGTTF